MSPKHTPTPWKWRVTSETDATGFGWVKIEASRGGLLNMFIAETITADGLERRPYVATMAQAKANFRFIVRAVNSHAALLEAAKAAREYLVERGIREKGTIGRAEVLPMLDRSIALAGKVTR